MSISLKDEHSRRGMGLSFVPITGLGSCSKSRQGVSDSTGHSRVYYNLQQSSII